MYPASNVSPLFRGSNPQSFNGSNRSNNPHANPLSVNSSGQEDTRAALSLIGSSSFEMDIDHSFSGTYRNPDGDLVTFSSNFSASLSYESEFQILFDENTRAIREAYGLEQPNEPLANQGAEQAEKSEDGDGLMELERMMPEFSRAEPTASRIVDFATSMLPFYLQNHGNELTEENLEGFMDLMGPAVDTGFAQAGDIIQNAELMDDNLSKLIQKTYDLVQQKFHTFRENMLEKINGAEQETEGTSADDESSSETGVLYSETSVTYEESQSTTLFTG